MRNILNFVLVILFFSSCKKEEEITIESFDFTIENSVVGFNDTVFFAAIGNDFESVSWNFGDGSTGEGIEVNHNYSAFDCFSVSATAKKGNASKTITKNVAVTKFKRLIITSVEVLQIPILAGAEQDYDPNDDPDLVLKLKMPEDSIYQCPITISNSRTGNFLIFPPQETNSIGQTIKFYLYDRDNGSVPDLYSIGSASLNVCPKIPTVNSASYVDSATISDGGVRMKVKFTWGN
jgi:hypothetical protein